MSISLTRKIRFAFKICPPNVVSNNIRNIYAVDLRMHDVIGSFEVTNFVPRTMADTPGRTTSFEKDLHKRKRLEITRDIHSIHDLPNAQSQDFELGSLPSESEALVTTVG